MTLAGEMSARAAINFCVLLLLLLVFFSHSLPLVWCAFEIKFKELTMRFSQGFECIRQCSQSRTVEKLSISIAKG